MQPPFRWSTGLHTATACPKEGSACGPPRGRFWFEPLSSGAKGRSFCRGIASQLDMESAGVGELDPTTSLASGNVIHHLRGHHRICGHWRTTRPICGGTSCRGPGRCRWVTSPRWTSTCGSRNPVRGPSGATAILERDSGVGQPAVHDPHRRGRPAAHSRQPGAEAASPRPSLAEAAGGLDLGDARGSHTIADQAGLLGGPVAPTVDHYGGRSLRRRGPGAGGVS